MNKFPTDEEYEEITKELARINDEEKDLRLTNGNCGIYAYALFTVFGEGELVTTDADTFAHVFLKINNRFYDAKHIYESLDDLKDSMWGEYINNEPIPIEDEYRYSRYNDVYQAIRHNTCHNLESDDFVEILENTITNIRNNKV